jgi:hypothetical protein
MSSKFDVLVDTVSSVATAIANMATIKSAAITVTYTGSAATKICNSGVITNSTLVFQAAFGNVPVLGLWKSVFYSGIENYYSTNSSANILRITTRDGRDNNIKLCNGVGKCDFGSGSCTCARGWAFDADLGVCGKLQVNTSTWGGLARCVGTVAYFNTGASGSNTVNDYKSNYGTDRMYVSLNPTPNNNITGDNSSIVYYEWSGSTLRQNGATVLVYLTSPTSAGPMVHDQAKDRLFFLDAQPLNPFIGVVNIFNNSMREYSKWLTVNYRIFGMALDAHFKRRKLYWTVPARFGNADGNIYWSYIDSASASVNSLAALIGQVGSVDKCSAFLLHN